MPNFNLRDILRLLRAPNRCSIYQILSNFPQNSLTFHEEDITSVGKSQPM